MIARANATEYGLGGSVWGNDEDRALEIARRIASGTVWVNETQHLSPTNEAVEHRDGRRVEGLLESTNAPTIVRKKRKEAAPA